MESDNGAKGLFSSYFAVRSYFSLFGMILFKLINGLGIFVEINLRIFFFFSFSDGTKSRFLVSTEFFSIRVFFRTCI